MELIFSTTLTSDTATISTGTLPTGYNAYKIYIRARGDNTAVAQRTIIRIYFNDDQTETNYQLFRIEASSAASPDGPGNGVNDNGVSIAATVLIPNAIAAAGFYAAAIINVYSPESTIGYKSYDSKQGSHTQPTGATQFGARFIRSSTGVWLNQSAITSILFKIPSSQSADIVAGSSVHVYGLK